MKAKRRGQNGFGFITGADVYEIPRTESSGQRPMETLARNVTPFTLDGWPVDALDQSTMVELRKLADQTGWTIAQVMQEVTPDDLARRRVAGQLTSKIIPFQIPNR